MDTCIFCKPEDFGSRKLDFEDKNGYWYTIVPDEIGTFGQVLMVVTRKEEDKRHIRDITDHELQNDKERLFSIIRGIHEIASRLKKCLEDQDGRKVEKIYVLTQCEGKNPHLHFQFLPRYENDPTGNEFLYANELKEARWQDPPKKPPSERIKNGKQILEKYKRLLKQGKFSHLNEYKSRKLKENVQRLNLILKPDRQRRKDV